MLGVFAEFERTTIVERITAGMRRAASQGRWVVEGPYGYLRDKQTKLIPPRATGRGGPADLRYVGRRADLKDSPHQSTFGGSFGMEPMEEDDEIAGQSPS